MALPTLWIVIPCYNEEKVLPITAPKFLAKLNDFIRDLNFQVKCKDDN